MTTIELDRKIVVANVIPALIGVILILVTPLAPVLLPFGAITVITCTAVFSFFLGRMIIFNMSLAEEWPASITGLFMLSISCDAVSNAFFAASVYGSYRPSLFFLLCPLFYLIGHLTWRHQNKKKGYRPSGLCLI